MNLQEILANHIKWLADCNSGEKADLRDNDLSDADLSGADLRRADLSDADLVVFQTGLWTAFIQKDAIRIGCQYHPTAKWSAFDDDAIESMHPLALRYWKKHKEIILLIAESLGAIA